MDPKLLQEVKEAWPEVGSYIESLEAKLHKLHGGRPKQYGPADAEKVKSCIRDGMSIRATAKALSMSTATVQRLKRL